MEQLNTFLESVGGVLWTPVMLVLLLGTGIFLTIGLQLLPLRKLGYGFRLLWAGIRPGAQKGEGEITPFGALMTSLSATIGTGNIAGVGTAIHLGGPGAVFWMWMTALVGMATKYAEAVLAVRYREVDSRNMHVGGPMYYIKNGLGARWQWLGAAFALFGLVAAFGIGNTVQSNSVADSMHQALAVPHWLTGTVMAAVAFAVIVGGIGRIARVAEALVPIMGVIYVLGALAILGYHYTEIPQGLARIVTDAFTGTAAVGGFAGAGVMAAIQFGVARGLFSNEAGLGSAPMAHASARTDDPVRQGMVGMLGTFIDTIVVCTMTALVIVTTGVWDSGETGAGLTTTAFSQGLPGPGDFVVAFGLVVFAFTTTLTWAFYGERCLEFLAGVKPLKAFRLIWVVGILSGSVASLELIWNLADITMALMAFPNLVALVLLSPVVFRISRDYFRGTEAKAVG
ncbi:sodium:alanine symporter [Thiohalorhabdus denitrificans]|uniref:Alanine or glycine:cation symporter, AGCS family n=1 Tax=Thiohalorhabdus denitrificans TaxID=381306 RepID=A0A0P9CR94_9GAMM|nr:sodium:alanine symporter family protein [Thiohalorhabdus denitrificans]KPV39198.1 sodium:alanine symporter [Thiohalorhabdus denitrificans]SCX75417.1 alanine or glycine:cation symporter, AGCS family [Thiohalorhabdus denitrificans]